MTWILNDDVDHPIADGAPFNTPTTKYPANWDKASVAGMVKVTETARPDDELYVVTGSHVEMVAGAPTRVWDKTARTAEDKAARHNAPILAQIAAKELATLRSIRELRRAEEFGDVPANAVTLAKNRLKTTDDQIIALRATLQ